MRLVAASLDPPEGLLDFLRDVGDGEAGFGGAQIGDAGLEAHLRRLVDNSLGLGLGEGQVPQTTFWLLDDSSRVVGMSRLRHSLTPALLHHGGHIGYYVGRSHRDRGYGRTILRLVLDEARHMGIEHALLTVDSDNLPSIRVIEANGGVLEDERLSEETGRPYRRYWIDLAPKDSRSYP